MSFIQCDNVVHFYERRPRRALESQSVSAATLVFVNALGTDHRIWDDVVEALPSALPVLCYDARGHGLTEAAEAPHGVADLSTDLFALLEQLGIGPVVLCGLSLGGLVAQHFAASRPGQVRAVCLAGTAARIGSLELWQSRIADVQAGGISSIAGSVIERWFSPAFRERDPSAVRGYRAMLERMPVAGYLAALRVLATADLRASAAKISAPALILAGEHDVATPPVVVEALAAAIPGARFELLPRAGHIMCVDEPLAFAQALLRFLGELEIV